MARVAVLAGGVNGTAASVDTIEWPVLPPTLLTIHRTSELDEQTRQIVLSLNGRRVGQLLFGDTLTCEIAPGPHRLRVHNTLVWKTIEFEAQPGAHVHYTVWNRGWGSGYYLMVVFVGAAPLGLGVAAGTPEALRARTAGGAGREREAHAGG